MIEILNERLENSTERLLSVKKSYDMTISRFRGYGKIINSKTINDDSIHLNSLSKEMSMLEIEISLIKDILKTISANEDKINIDNLRSFNTVII